MWGPGLYSADFAADLRSMIATLSRLPIAGHELLSILRSKESDTADNAQNEDHTTFWFVVADQFTKRGIACDGVKETTLALIDSGVDAQMLRSLGMSAADLAKREKSIAELRARLVSDESVPRKSTRKAPSFTMACGDVFAYPTDRGKSFYVWDSTRLIPWNPDGWGALLVVDRGLAFSHLPWYRIMAVEQSLEDKPSLDALLDRWWRLRGMGTCSKVHFRRLGLDFVTHVDFDPLTIAKLPMPRLQDPENVTLNDHSIFGDMYVYSRSATAEIINRTATWPPITLRDVLLIS